MKRPVPNIHNHTPSAVFVIEARNDDEPGKILGVVEDEETARKAVKRMSHLKELYDARVGRWLDDHPDRPAVVVTPEGEEPTWMPKRSYPKWKHSFPDAWEYVYQRIELGKLPIEIPK